MTDHPDVMTLAIDGRRYQGWTSARVDSGIDRCVRDFQFEVSERWAGQATPWRILPFASCVVAIDGEAVVTGYVDEYNPALGPADHAVSIAGRSRTVDLVECTPDVPSGQYTGYSLEAIARAQAAIYSLGVTVETAAAASVFANAMFERGETSFTFLERLGRLSGVLLSDDAKGNLVLTRAGALRASGALVEGQNILRASARLSSRGRYSDYIVKGQLGLVAGGGGLWGGLGGVGAPSAAQNTQTVQTALVARAHDAGVPRYRPRVVIASSQRTQDQMQQRADWLMHAAYGHATQAEIIVQGWRQPDGALWQSNRVVAVQAPSLGVEKDLLIARVGFDLSPQSGRTTRLTVGPVEGYTPEPGQVRIGKKAGKGGASPAATWDGFGG